MRTAISVLGVIKRSMSSKVNSKGVIVESPLRMFNVTHFEYDPDPHPAVRQRVPGLTCETYDRDWNPKMPSIMTITSIARIYALHRPISTSKMQLPKNTPLPWSSDSKEETYLDWARLTSKDSNLFTFMSSTEFVMSRALYDTTLPKWEVDMEQTLGNVGNCSIAQKSKFYAISRQDSDDDRGPTRESLARKEPLWTNTYQLVSVDKTTRKPTKLPDWFKEKFDGRGCMDKGLVLRGFARPDVTYVHPLTVQWSDTDNYKHTNWASYVRWATDTLHAALLLSTEKTSYSPHLPRVSSTNTLDAVEDNQVSPFPNPSPAGAATVTNAQEVAAATRALKGITKEAVSRGLQKMQVSYFQECLEGENVDVHLWQEATAGPNVVFVSVVKGSVDCCQIKMWYFEEEEEDEPYPV